MEQVIKFENNVQSMMREIDVMNHGLGCALDNIQHEDNWWVNREIQEEEKLSMQCVEYVGRELGMLDQFLFDTNFFVPCNNNCTTRCDINLTNNICNIDELQQSVASTSSDGSSTIDHVGTETNEHATCCDDDDDSPCTSSSPYRQKGRREIAMKSLYNGNNLVSECLEP